MIPISLHALALGECLMSMAQLSCSPANFPFSESGGLCKEVEPQFLPRRLCGLGTCLPPAGSLGPPSSLSLRARLLMKSLANG